MKSRIGISVGFLGALSFFLAQFVGYTPLILLVGYVLLREKNDWLRFICTKALVLALCFTVITSVLYLVPDFLGIINAICRIFDGSGVKTPVFNSILNSLETILNFVEKYLFVILGCLAFFMKTIRIPVIDNFVEKIVASVAEMQNQE